MHLWSHKSTKSEQLLHKQETRISSDARSSINNSGELAQMVERSLCMWEVRGSMPRFSRIFFSWGKIHLSITKWYIARAHWLIEYNVILIYVLVIGLHCFTSIGEIHFVNNKNYVPKVKEYQDALSFFITVIVIPVNCYTNIVIDLKEHLKSFVYVYYLQSTLLSTTAVRHRMPEHNVTWYSIKMNFIHLYQGNTTGSVV